MAHSDKPADVFTGAVLVIVGVVIFSFALYGLLKFIGVI